MPDDVSVSWGRSSRAGQAEYSTLGLTLKNTDGRFTAYNPLSPYWPHVRRWTPIEFDIDLGDGAGWRNRFSGFVRKWPLTWPGRSEKMAVARIEAVGVLCRLGRGNPPAKSSLRRTIPATGTLAYWPAEDGPASGQAASAFPDHPPLTIVGVYEFAPIESWKNSQGYSVDYGTAGLVDVSGGATMTAAVPATVTVATATAWTVAVCADIPDTRATDLVLVEIATPGGTHSAWRLVVTTTARTQVHARNSAGTWVIVVDNSSLVLSMFSHNLAVWQSGGNIQVGFNWDSVSGYKGSGSVAGTLAGVAQVVVNPTASTAAVPTPMGHIAVWAGHSLTAVDLRDGPVVLALFGYGWSSIASGAAATGEPATERLARLAAEDGVPLAMAAADPGDEVMMGLQRPGTALDLYQGCEAADAGLLYEDGFGLGYLPRTARYNQPVALTIDAAAGELGTPFEPVDDDQMLRNKWTVERIDGSSAVAADEESIILQGEIEDSVTLNLASDHPLPDHAGWRLRLSTVQEPRYPAVTITLSSSRGLAAAWCACKSGSRVQVINPPEQNPPGTVDQLVVGATEVYRGRRSWRATMNVEPAAPWLVATASGPHRAAAAGSTLATDITAGAMSLSLTSTAAGGLWTTKASAFPLDLLIGGERVTVSAITGTSSPQAATVTARAVNGVSRSWQAGTPVQVWSPAVVPL
ncbi:hypothetical protein [Micromonospora sp. KC213]|uniref:hypothetical protein n=1 Tax=Micromonospora sp. KC213 TaxID=2530378 RepID=UPI00104355B7|nr:hypothetical protein [Micromonospora sp. KC213]TDC42096.1 hypothetical protein E1166_09060 [Micromonospora sp. KC213]